LLSGHRGCSLPPGHLLSGDFPPAHAVFSDQIFLHFRAFFYGACSCEVSCSCGFPVLTDISRDFFCVGGGGGFLFATPLPICSFPFWFFFQFGPTPHVFGTSLSTGVSTGHFLPWFPFPPPTGPFEYPFPLLPAVWPQISWYHGFFALNQHFLPVCSSTLVLRFLDMLPHPGF